jgi:two-component system response regulator AtoC
MATAIQTPHNGKTILIADDEPEIREYLQLALRCGGYSVEVAVDGREVLHRLHCDQHGFSLVLLDVLMPGQNGLETLRDVRKLHPQLPVIMFSSDASSVTVVEAMRNGATNFISKPISHEDLVQAVDRALPAPPLSPRPFATAPAHRKPGSMSFRPIEDVESIIAKIGTSSVPVLIQGETGVGKEVVARRLHQQSSRSTKPFLKLNCAALPSELVESELFGHERGAFTGAVDRKPGLFELAAGGTIFLDEIGDMYFKLQAKLLQVLQDHEFQRVGGRQLIHVDVRVIAATHCDLEVAISEKRFRADLFYRLNVVSVVVPPLRERKDEIIPMAEFLIAKHAEQNDDVRLPVEVRRALVNYSWPGNVRELDNVVRRWLVLQEAQHIIAYLQRDSNPEMTNRSQTERNRVGPSPAGTRSSGSGLPEVSEASRTAEREAILGALNAARWNRKKAAVSLGVDYKALLYKMKKLGIDTDAREVPGEQGSSTSDWIAHPPRPERKCG